MRISKIVLDRFKRFQHLTIDGLPPQARLVILAGPNGNGKSSLFDGLLNWRRRAGGMGNDWDVDYHAREKGHGHRTDAVKVEFHEPAPRTPDELAGSIHIRTAFRNDPVVQIDGIGSMPAAIRDVRFTRLTANDAGVVRNLQRMMGQDLELLHSEGDPSTTFGEHRVRLQGRINEAFANLGLSLRMDGLGNPLQKKTFRFSKGAVSGYHFNNLSGGERTIFDLLFDLIVQREAFGNAVYCIDEPESHVNPNLHGKLLDELLSLVPEDGQLWIATHSIGMLRKARDLQRSRPSGEVLFLDFDQDFDRAVVLTPLTPDPEFWKRSLTTAIGDIAELVAPEIIVFCEGHNPKHELGKGTDAQIYQRIFSEEFPEAVFTSIGSSNDVSGRFGDGIAQLFSAIRGATVIRLIDGDRLSASERESASERRITVLSRRHIESYLYDDEVLAALCESVGRADRLVEVLDIKRLAIEGSTGRGNASDDAKKWCSEFRAAVTKMLGLPGNTDWGFAIDVLSPLVKPNMRVYQGLKGEIFGAVVVDRLSGVQNASVGTR